LLGEGAEVSGFLRAKHRHGDRHRFAGVLRRVTVIQSGVSSCTNNLPPRALVFQDQSKLYTETDEETITRRVRASFGSGLLTCAMMQLTEIPKAMKPTLYAQMGCLSELYLADNKLTTLPADFMIMVRPNCCPWRAQLKAIRVYNRTPGINLNLKGGGG
jgi:hypothetical protein